MPVLSAVSPSQSARLNTLVFFLLLNLELVGYVEIIPSSRETIGLLLQRRGLLTMSPGCLSQFKSIWAKVSRKKRTLAVQPEAPGSDTNTDTMTATLAEKAANTLEPSAPKNVPEELEGTGEFASAYRLSRNQSGAKHEFLHRRDQARPLA